MAGTNRNSQPHSLGAGEKTQILRGGGITGTNEGPFDQVFSSGIPESGRTCSVPLEHSVSRGIPELIMVRLFNETRGLSRA